METLPRQSLRWKGVGWRENGYYTPFLVYNRAGTHQSPRDPPMEFFLEEVGRGSMHVLWPQGTDRASLVAELSKIEPESTMEKGDWAMRNKNPFPNLSPVSSFFLIGFMENLPWAGDCLPPRTTEAVVLEAATATFQCTMICSCPNLPIDVS